MKLPNYCRIRNNIFAMNKEIVKHTMQKITLILKDKYIISFISPPVLIQLHLLLIYCLTNTTIILNKLSFKDILEVVELGMIIVSIPLTYMLESAFYNLSGEISND